MNLGVFFSTCKGTIGTSIDLDALAKHYAASAVARVFDDFYDVASFEEILQEVDNRKLDGIVLAGGSPLDYKQIRNGEYLFSCLDERGINSNRVEVVNLVNMVVRPHKNKREELEAKARVLVDVAIEKIKSSDAVETIEVAPRKAVAIVGATSASIMLAQPLLETGYKVYLLNRDRDLALPQESASLVQPTLAQVSRHPRFVRIDEANVLEFFGYPGDHALRLTSQGAESTLQIGAVVLALDSEPRWLKELHSVFHIDLDEKNELAARHDVTSRSQTHDRGLFVINPSGGAKASFADHLLAADATAAMVTALLSQSEIVHPVMASHVNELLCGGCGACVKTCMFHGVTLQGRPPVSVIDPRRCRGCGNCVTACPAGARDLLACPTDYLFKAVEIMAGFEHAESNGKVLLIACDGCGYQSLDHAASMQKSWPIGVMPLWVVCGGQIDTQLVMHALAKGFDGVVLLICGEGCCHNLIGNVDLERRVNLLRDVLTSRGIDHGRVEIIATCSRDGRECVEGINQFCSQFNQRELATHTMMLE